MLEVSPYAYAKACGIIGKSFVGKRLSSLNGLYTLNDLDRLLFPDYMPNLTSKELLPDLERRITMRAVNQIFSIVDSYRKPPKLIEQMIRAYEYSDLKSAINAIILGKKEMPYFCNIGRFRRVNFNAYPDINKMLKNTEFEFLLREDLAIISHNIDTLQLESKIDSLYYKGLSKSLDQLYEDEDKRLIQKFLLEEISLKNCSYAMRLRTFYNMQDEDVMKYFIDVKISGKKKGSLVSDAAESLKLPLDSRYQWENWKWEELLNPEEVTVNWMLDPRYFQNAASNYLYKLASRYFRRNPMAVSAIFCFIKLIEFEEDMLTSIAEGLALGMDSNTVFSLLEVA